MGDTEKIKIQKFLRELGKLMDQYGLPRISDALVMITEKLDPPVINVKVIVKGGLVQAVYTDAKNQVAADVIDLDLSDTGVTDEEMAEYKRRDVEAETIKNNPDYEAIW